MLKGYTGRNCRLQQNVLDQEAEFWHLAKHYGLLLKEAGKDNLLKQAQ